MTQRTGRCLCGAVKVQAVLREPRIGACHCGQCQRWTGGGPLLSVPITDLTIEGQDHIHEFAVSEWGRRAFCRACGSTLFWRMADGPVRNMAVGLLDDQSGLAVTDEIFVDCRAPWLDPVAGATQSTEAEEFAKLRDYLESKA